MGTGEKKVMDRKYKTTKSHREAQKRYYRKHRERYRLLRKKNKESHQKWQEENREKTKEYNRRIRKTEEYQNRKKIYKQIENHPDLYPLGFECAFCGATEKLEHGHLDYETEGFNYLTVCHECNMWMERN